MVPAARGRNPADPSAAEATFADFKKKVLQFQEDALGTELALTPDNRWPAGLASGGTRHPDIETAALDSCHGERP